LTPMNHRGRILHKVLAIVKILSPAIDSTNGPVGAEK
jgi:hypothetical protein